MHVIVDADACPRSVMQFLLKQQEKRGFRLITVASVNHLIETGEHITVGPESQAADLAIINRVQAGDLVVTGDWGLAAMVLGKQASALSPSGQIYDNERMDFMLEQRNLLARHRRGGGRTKGPAARSKADDDRFEKAFFQLIKR